MGSSSYITNLDGEVVLHIEYVPFGEVFIEERNNTWNTPYLFNAKEYDEETGLYYYGARYMNPITSLWYGVDPKVTKYPNVSGYCYTVNNPVIFIDPDGKDLTSAIAETIGTFVISAGASFVEELVTNGGDVNAAMHQIDWKGVSIEALTAGATSLVFSGVSTAKLIKKLAGTKFGRSNLAKVLTSTVANMISSVSASIAKGEKLSDINLVKELFVALAGTAADAGLGMLSENLMKSLQGAEKTLTNATKEYRAAVRARHSKFYRGYLKNEIGKAQKKVTSLKRKAFAVELGTSMGTNSAQKGFEQIVYDKK